MTRKPNKPIREIPDPPATPETSVQFLRRVLGKLPRGHRPLEVGFGTRFRGRKETAALLIWNAPAHIRVTFSPLHRRDVHDIAVCVYAPVTP